MWLKNKKFFFVILSFYISTFAEAILPENWSNNKVFVFPKDGREPWLKIIESSQKTIDIAAYKLSDPAIIQALKEACQRDISINLLIEPDTFHHEKSDNIKSPIEELREMGVKIFNLSPRFNQAHYKMIVGDNKIGLISTGNLDAESFDGILAKNIPKARDFATLIKDVAILSKMQQTFLADIQDRRIIPNNPPLVWGPDQQRSIFLRLINSAKKSIHIYQQDIQDVGIVQALVGAARDKVDVKILMMPFPFSKKEDKNIPNQTILREAGAQVRLNSEFYIHAKILIIDGKQMYLGSGNFYTPSIDQTRELGILLAEPEAIDTVLGTFQYDWDKSSSFLENAAQE